MAGLHKHKMIHYPAKAATTKAEGNIEYWRCAECGKLFADEAGKKEITKNDIKIPKKSTHKHKLVHHKAVAPTKKKAGNIEYWKCSKCGKYYADKNGKKEISAKDIVIPKLTPEKVGTKFTVDGNEYRITSSKASALKVTLVKGAKKSKVTVPATVKRKNFTYKVTAIDKKAFYGNKNVTQVTGGANVETIGEQAFAKCPKLVSFTAEKNVSKISSKCFEGSKKLETITVKTKKLKKNGVKASLKGSAVNTVAVKVGNKSANKKLVKAYSKIFTKSVCGRKVTVK